MRRQPLKTTSWLLLLLLVAAVASPVSVAAGTAPLASGGTGGTTGQAAVQKKAGKVAIVAQSGGDYTSPVAAMSNLASWCGTPSSGNPCLVKIMPGVYDLAGGSLTMQSYVDVEGSGENTTVITSTFTYDRQEPLGVVNGADNAELRFLTVHDKTGYPYQRIAISNNGQSPNITHVTAIAAADGYYGAMGAYPLTYSVPAGSCGVLNTNSSATMSNVTVKASGGGWSSAGVFNVKSSPTMNDVVITADSCESNVGIYNDNSSPRLSNVTVKTGSGMGSTAMWNTSASAVTILVDRSDLEAGSVGETLGNSVNNSANVTLAIGGSKLVGTVTNTGTITCVASYNGDYVALGTGCQ